MNDVVLSKSLSWILRHGALKEGLNISEDGYIKVSDILHHRTFSGKYSVADIERIVATNNKQRFSLRETNGMLEICANQGHSLEVSDLDLEQIKSLPDFQVIHGTYYKNWEKIKVEGLSRMRRNHIHFATGLPHEKNITSGIRKDTQVFIYVDLEKALNDGLIFYKSKNGVILCPGDENGKLEEGCKQADVLASTSKEFYCEVCAKQYNNSNEFSQHYDSKYHKKNKETQEQNKRMDDKCCLFIKGFSTTTKQEVILEYFKQFGDIIAANFVHNFLFLDYTNPDSAKKAVNKPCYIEGKRLLIDYREPRPNQKISKSTDDFHPTWIAGLSGIPDFDAETLRLLQTVQPNPHSVQMTVSNICSEMHSALSHLSPRLRIHNFGSTVTGLQLNFSDLDVYVGGIRDETKAGDEVGALYRIKYWLVNSGKFGSAFVIPNAKIPILKCVHLETMINIDVNVKNMLGVYNSLLLRYYLESHWKLKGLMVDLKFWASTHKITGQNHLFTNYSLCLMFIFYLQQWPYCLPEVARLQSSTTDFQDGWNAGFDPLPISWVKIDSTPSLDILKGFFEFYFNFSYSTKVICPFVGCSIDKKLFEDPILLPNHFSLYKRNVLHNKFEPLHTNSSLCLQDPFEQNRNTTKVLSSTILENFVNLCELGRRICSKNENSLYKLLTMLPINLKKIEPTITPCLLVMLIAMRQNLSYLKSSDNIGRKIEWFNVLTRFLRIVLTDFLKFTVVEKDKVSSSSAKNLKGEGQSDIHESPQKVQYMCSSKMNLWNCRNATAKSKKEGGVIEKQIEVTKEMIGVYQHLQNTEDVISFQMTLTLLVDEPTHVKLELAKVAAYKKSFRSFATFFSKNAPCWFETYEKELAVGKK